MYVVLQYPNPWILLTILKAAIQEEKLPVFFFFFKLTAVLSY